jgi:hypothetical protein
MSANTKQTKKAAASASRERGEDRFMWSCKAHGEQPHYSSNQNCVECQRERAGKRWERTRKDPDALARHAERQRAAMAKLREQQPEQRAKDRNNAAIRRLRELERPETAMPTAETLQKCLEVILAAPPGADMDHAVPLKGMHPVTGKWVVSGLHTPHNLEPMDPLTNKRKSNWFDPENPFEFQKPFNSFPGGQFHGDHAEDELMRYTTPTTLHIMTIAEFEAAIIEGADAEMEEFLHLQGGETAASA